MKKTDESKKPKESQSKLKETKKRSREKKLVLGHGVGRRKCAVARVWLRRGKGIITVNKKDFRNYFDTDYNRDQASIPFNVLSISHYDVDINVIGGGVNSQAEAVKLGISRALVNQDPAIRSTLRKWRLLTVDSRVKERKKYGQRGARRKFQFVKR